MKKNSSIRKCLIVFTLLVVFSCTTEDPIVVIGNIEGTVNNIENNQAIQGVNVHLTSNGISTFIEQSKETGSDGKFSFKDLAAGSYKLSFQKNGYEDNSKNISLLAGYTSSSDIGLTPVKPNLSVNISSLDFNENETNLTFSIQNIGKGTLIWEVKESIDWLTVNPSSGTTLTETSPVSVKIVRDNVEPGNYERTISVTSNGGNATITIRVVIKGPKLEVTPMNIDFGSDINVTKKTILIKNSGIGNLEYSLSSDANWISSIIPSMGTLVTNETDAIEISINRSGLNYGNYSGKINVLTRAGNVAVDVKLTVPDPNKPQLSISPKTINFGVKGTTDNLTIKNSGRGILEWSLTDNQLWIVVSANSGSLGTDESKVLIVTTNRNGLAPNHYAGVITVTSNGGNETCNIEMEIPAEPILSFEPNTLNFGHDKESLPFTIKNNGTGNLNWTLTPNKTWITLSETSNTNQSTINVSVNRAALENGSFSGQVGISSNGGTGSIVINLEKRKPNTAPVVDFSVTPSSGYLETNFALSITCTDDYTSVANLQTRWKWQDEDAFSDWSTVKSSSHSYTTAGTKRITVEVKDEDGLTTSKSKTIVANNNEKPNATFTVSPMTGTLNTVFMVDANESSDDFTSKENLQVRWKWGDNVGFTTWSTTKTASHSYALAGNWTITLEVKDEAGLVNSTTRSITILESEKEPNDFPAQAQGINLNSTIIGTLNNNDRDYYTFIPLENGNISLSIKNSYNGGYYGIEISNCMLYKYTDNMDYYWIDYLLYLNVPQDTRRNSNKVPISKGVKYLIFLNASFNPNIPYELTSIFDPLNVSDNFEPNNFYNQAIPINLNSTITSLIGYSDDDMDYYTFIPSRNGNFSFSIKNLHSSSISKGDIGLCSLSLYGESGTITSTTGSISAASTKTSGTVSLIGGVKYLIKVPQYDSGYAAPYELTTFFQ